MTLFISHFIVSAGDKTVGDTYYLAGTTMHMNPAVQLMQTKDLVNWELAGYCMDRLDLRPAFRLEDGRGIYGRGIWAPCLRYHNGMFYIFSNVNGGDTMLMSLTNHRYLATTPNSPGAVTANATGPAAARQSGAEFKWKTIAE